jgi:hypothetical protein
MRCAEVLLRPERHDTGRVDGRHAPVIMTLDMIHTYGFGNTVHLVKIAKVIRQIVIVSDPAQVALEMAVVDRIESYEGGE